ncbi:craniofacial development protein 1 [Etheostoma cragini]|uniref:craniofacial development protein 1 n=1 Tax=Etheostoma cragini TaxID=417921 RepID=UPI00155DE00A|nr:craniofacial development protein 1 [Etheostoma cragini]
MMNYSDYDSDGYSSNEDADYVPSDDNLSEDDINECEKEEPLHEGDDVPHPDNGSKKKRKKKDISVRKRKKGVLKVDGEEKDGGGADEAQPAQDEVQQQVPGGRQEDDDSQKKKSDDLWASFLSDVGSRPKDPPPASQSSTTPKDDSSVVKVAPLSSETKASEPAKVTITQVFDFAGEEVRVEKVVSADSREAKSYLKSQNTQQEGCGDETEKASTPQQPPPPGPRYASTLHRTFTPYSDTFKLGFECCVGHQVLPQSSSTSLLLYLTQANCHPLSGTVTGSHHS